MCQCEERMPPPKDTSQKLAQLRALMQKNEPQKLDAYIVPTADAHSSEYVGECDKRRAFITGFTGSAGTAIITEDQAYMWTDGRYFLQAQEQMDSNWTLMKEELPSTPTQGTWLTNNLKSGSIVGVDPDMMSYNLWLPLKDQLETSGITLLAVETNLIDQIWSDKPAAPCNPVIPHPLKYTGIPIKEKLSAIQQKMKEKQVSLLVVSFLDEIAWFLNLRGSDIVYNPVFFSYVIINEKSFILFIDKRQYTKEVQEHLISEVGSNNFQIEGYDRIKEVLKSLIGNITGNVWLAKRANTALNTIVPHKCLIGENDPIQLMKAIKNPTEIRGMRNALIKDGVALCSYLAWLEKAVKSGELTEISSAEKLNKFKAEQEDFVGPSFGTISAVGPHAAIIHYIAKKETDVPIRSDSIYLCDSGGQYKDGTTDVTRTVHFGTPTDFERECFTRVLKGQIKLGSSIFPSKIKGNYLDSLARQYLWEIGLDYGHGTGHGIGSYLIVHEGPIVVSYRSSHDDPGLEPGMFLSNEPGYYQDGQFGIRIEDIVQIVEAKTPHNFNKRGFLTFETVSMCPIQTKLIKADMLTEFELNYLNNYHKMVREVLSPVLEKQGRFDVKEWLWKETEPLRK